MSNTQADNDGDSTATPPTTAFPNAELRSATVVFTDYRCQTCDGSGTSHGSVLLNDGVPSRATRVETYETDCPDCNASGTISLRDPLPTGRLPAATEPPC